MKKKFIYSLIGLLSFCLMAGSLDAKDTIDAKIPSNVPDVGKQIYVGVDQKEFDFSKISFTSANGGDDITGSTKLRKIFVVPEKITWKNLSSLEDYSFSGEYFTTYCLDGNLLYPEMNEFNYLSLSDVLNNQIVEYLAFTIIFNDSKFNSYLNGIDFNKYIYNGFIFSDNEGNNIDLNSESTYETFAKVISVTDKYGNKVKNNEGVEIDDYYTAFLLDSSNYIHIKVKSAKFLNLENPEDEKIINFNNDLRYYDLNSSFEDLLLNIYKSNSKTTSTYDKAFWISEHAYPSLTLEDTYKEAGTSYTDALAEVLFVNYNHEMNTPVTDLYDKNSTTLDAFQQFMDLLNQCKEDTSGSLKSTYSEPLSKAYGIIFESQDSSDLKTILGVESLDKTQINTSVCKKTFDYFVDVSNIEDYTYSTIQYAIWNVSNGYDSNGLKLGNTLKGSTELNKLYQYLIDGAISSSNYSNFSFDNKITLNKPKNGNEIFKDNSDNYIYGPYSLSGNVKEINDVNLSIKDSINGVSIVDKDGNNIEKINSNDIFYIKADKSEKLANVSIKANVSYDTYDNRARVYNANSIVFQNIISGGKIISTSKEEVFDIDFNPKTGYVNIAVIFGISIVAFAIGYVILNRKSPEINFD